ncbi:uncharacterized protein K452DRAFT_282003 [Aplosporella prunicola CBS 121167]|uniref:Cytochrome P450 monooxygenase n=1 Tax=Aplosporella prunicola CBS 121167 TaxID=1176127 RepID=A0A6A6BSR5_9PEZI|nr:uncharacterized protein K452DRAFT_282003 [Aplosporella prunicola CBS 121167]KAF2147020.1 hypothetical protein K452DRAFT_282003 [Aplosporella prunicola CBS 121167]
MSPLSGITAIPYMILAHGGNRSLALAEMHKTHPVIRTGPNTLSYGDVRAIKDIYGHNTKCTKDESYIAGAGTHYHLADVVDKPEHSRKRKVLSSAYALKNLEGWEHKVADKVERLIAHIDKVCTDALPKGIAVPKKEDITLDFREWANYFTLDAIADIGVSERLGFLDQGNDRVVGRNSDGTTYECNLREVLYSSNHKQSLLLWAYSWYPFLNKVSHVIPYYRRLGNLGKQWDGLPAERAHRRLMRYEAGEKLDDFFQAMMEDKNGNPNNLEWGEIVAEVNIMMNAGSVTTAIAITNILLQLIRNPECLAKLREEIDAVMDEDQAVASYDQVKHLPYLRACLDESLRLFPPTPASLGRETPPEGTTIIDDFIPGGTSVGISAVVAHRDEHVYPQAEKFVPERFLGENGKALQPYFITFSAGARGCIGRNISYLEQTVAVASIIHRYDFALPYPDWDIERRDAMNWILGPMPVKVWRRNMKAAEEGA